MKYYVIKPKVKEEYIYIRSEDINIPISFARYSCSGMKIKDDFVPKLINRNVKDKKTDFIAGPKVTPIISNKFKSLLKNESNIQFQQAEILNAWNGEIDQNFYHLHTLDNLNCINLKQSSLKIGFKNKQGKWSIKSIDQIDEYPEKWIIEETSKIILLDEKVNGRCLFRDVHLQSIIVINEHLKNKIEEAGLIGIDIQPLETYKY